MANMRAVNTLYGDRTFRSRLEAVWAAFFDIAGVEWEYEPGNVAGSSWWPDFRIHGVEFLGDRAPVLAEVKPVAFDPVMVSPLFNKALRPDWALMLGKSPSFGFVGFLARKEGECVQTIGVTVDSERGLHAARLDAPTSAAATTWWREAQETVTPIGVSMARNKVAEKMLGGPQFDFNRWRNQ